MLKYERTIDLEAGMDGVYHTNVEPLPAKPSGNWIWKPVAVVLLLALCSTAAVFFCFHIMKPEQKELQMFGEPQISEQGKMLKQIAQSTKAAIHLHGERGVESLTWLKDVDQSFVQGRLQLKDNKIRIPANGLYFVYSQVSYATMCAFNSNNNEVEDNDESDDRKFLSHTIWRYTETVDKPVPLQNSGHYACQSPKEGETSYSTIYMGAVFKLTESDSLGTNTTFVEDVDENSAKTFFGVFAL